MREHGFLLSKRDFTDAIALHYGWPLKDTPTKCPCGASFSVDHAMVCSLGGLPTVRHNEVRDLVGTLLTEVCHSVALEPVLVPLSGQKFEAKTTTTCDEARADVQAAGFWTRGEDAYFDVRVFHPDASSYLAKSPADLFHMHEQRKRLQYQERIINVDHGSFAPLVFSTAGAAGPTAEHFLRRLAGKLSDRDNLSYSCVMSWHRCRLSFALLRSAILCVHGSRSCRHRPMYDCQLAAVNSRLSPDG